MLRPLAQLARNLFLPAQTPVAEVRSRQRKSRQQRPRDGLCARRRKPDQVRDVQAGAFWQLGSDMFATTDRAQKRSRRQEEKNERSSESLRAIRQRQFHILEA